MIPPSVANPKIHPGCRIARENLLISKQNPNSRKRKFHGKIRWVKARYLGLDLGGTNIKYAIIENSGSEWSVVVKDQISTEAEIGPDHVTNLLAGLAKKFGDEVSGVGLAVPGTFDDSAGTILIFPNLPGPWQGHQILAPVANASSKPTALINDARAFALAESILGAARGLRTVACLVLGTGIGGGIIIDGKVITGSTGAAGELGHVIVDPNGNKCGCGSRGCLETTSATVAICTNAKSKTPADAYEKAAAGDAIALEAFKIAGRGLGVAITSIMVTLSPDAFVIGGGVSQAGEMLNKYIREEVDSRLTIFPPNTVKLIPAELGVYAGAIGAALNGAIAAGVELVNN